MDFLKSCLRQGAASGGGCGEKVKNGLSGMSVSMRKSSSLKEQVRTDISDASGIGLP